MDNKPGPVYKFLPRQWRTVVIIGVSEPDSWVQIPGLPTIIVTIIIINFVGRRGKLLKLTDSQFPLLENKDRKGTRLGAKSIKQHQKVQNMRCLAHGAHTVTVRHAR